MQTWEEGVAIQYDVTTVTVRPGTLPKAMAVIEKSLAKTADLLACWTSDIGALNRILILRGMTDADAVIAARMDALTSRNPFGVGEFIAGMAMDTYVAFDFLPPVQPGEYGPCYEVRTYMLKPDGLTPTAELWRKAVPGRVTVSPLLTAMTSVTGTVIRFMHIWPYKSVEERGRMRAKAIADKVWPPPGGAAHIAAQQSDIYLPAPFSPLR